MCVGVLGVCGVHAVPAGGSAAQLRRLRHGHSASAAAQPTPAASAVIRLQQHQQVALPLNDTGSHFFFFISFCYISYVKWYLLLHQVLLLVA